jgi:hypothetical protein
MLAINQELSLIFATPLSIRTVAGAAALNTGLERAILARRQQYRGKQLSNIGGWQSLPDLLDWPEPEVKQLAAEADLSVQQIWALPALLKGRRHNSPCPAYRAWGWANVNEPGDYNMLHMHPGCHLSIVYYVTPGTPIPDSGTNGRLELRDPRPVATYSAMPGGAESGVILIGPEAGMMVTFPAWIEHAVHPFRGEGPRISIAINITFAGN